MSMCEEPKKYVSLSAWQDNRNNQTDFKHNNQLWPQDGTSWSEMLYCTEHCWSEKSSEIAFCFLTTPRWMQMNIKWLQPYTKKAGRIDPNINSINLERGLVKEKKKAVWRKWKQESCLNENKTTVLSMSAWAVESSIHLSTRKTQPHYKWGEDIVRFSPTLSTSLHCDVENTTACK